MNWQALIADLEWTYREKPSLGRLLIEAVRSVQGGLATLATHGHPFRVAAGADAVIEYDWPRTYYHYDLGPQTVGSPGQLAEMGPGWYPSPSAASQARGEDIQFLGRGGVRRNRGLAVPPGSESQFVPSGPSKADIKAKFLAQRRHLNGHG